MDVKHPICDIEKNPAPEIGEPGQDELYQPKSWLMLVEAFPLLEINIFKQAYFS